MLANVIRSANVQLTACLLVVTISLGCTRPPANSRESVEVVAAVVAFAVAGNVQEPPTPPSPPKEASPSDLLGLADPGISSVSAELSVSPNFIAIDQGRFAEHDYTIDYLFRDMGKILDASVEVSVPGIGVLQTQEIPTSSQGITTFHLNAQLPRGPLVAVRGHCPGGDTDWFTLGRDEETLPAVGTASDRPVIERATYKRHLDRLFHVPDGGGGAGEPIKIFGQNLSPECTFEASVNRDTVELFNVFPAYPRGRAFQALIRYADLGNRPIGSRYAEVKVRAKGISYSREVIRRISFLEVGAQ